MASYSLIKRSKLRFDLLKDDTFLGSLQYRGSFSQKAEIILANQEVYNIVVTGFWSVTFQLRKGNQIFAQYRMAWNGMLIENIFQHPNSRLLLKSHGFYSRKYELLNENKDKLLHLEGEKSLWQMHGNCSIHSLPQFLNFSENTALLLTIIHAMHYHKLMLVSAAT
ncbi:MAG: hypothetical protein Q4F57_00380 [Weeksellaceae bacterium]|nr:hypothetical protein [Weeksellaceae bacterium]